MTRQPTFPELLEKRREAFMAKPELTLLYEMWAERIKKDLGPGPTIELGNGTSPFEKALPDVFFSDQSSSNIYDLTCKTDALPFLPNSVGNFILFDVFHHLADPVRFLQEAEKCLRPNGRILIYDLAITPFSYIFFNLQAKEKAILSEGNPFLPNPIRAFPMRGNAACVHLMFRRDHKRFTQMFPNLRMITHEKRDFLCFLLFRGYERKWKKLAAYFPLLKKLEERLMPLSKLFAMRTFLVLEKRP